VGTLLFVSGVARLGWGVACGTNRHL